MGGRGAGWRSDRVDGGRPAVAGRLPSADGLQRYLRLVVDLMRRTSVSIHGHHATGPSPGLPAFLQAAPRATASTCVQAQ